MKKITGNDEVELFTRFADKYCNKIEDSHIAEDFFKDFLTETGGCVNIDCLDTDNDDRIECVYFDHNEGMMLLCTRVPEKDAEMREMRKMVFPFDIYSFLIRFKNIHFVRIKDGNCIAIVVNGYTMKKKMIQSFAKTSNYTIKGYDEKSSFFTSNLVRERDGIYEYIRAMKTPITSFWIIPKCLIINTQESKRHLYLYNAAALEERLKNWMQKLDSQIKTTKDREDIDAFIKMYGNQIRTGAEALFKLVTCFYHEKFDFKGKDKEYNDRLLGDLISPLKKFVYTSQDDELRLSTIVRVANELSHDSGLPVKIADIGELYEGLVYYISNFKERVSSCDDRSKPEVFTQPSPRDYIDENIKKWDFNDVIAKTVKTDSCCGCTYRLRIERTFIDWILFSKEADYLCKDGYIKTLNRTDMSEVLEINSRENVIAIVESINNKVKSDCEAQGFDKELAYLSWSIDIIRKNKPSHLFTLDEIKKLMTDADDSKNNKLVIDEDGYAHIITNPGLAYLYPVSIETWCAGNGYVGQDSSLSDAEPAYHLCLSLWLDYLITNKKQYDDCYRQIDVDKTIEEIKKYY